MNSSPQSATGPRKENKRVHFKRDSILEDIRIIESREHKQQRNHQERERQHQIQQQERTLKQEGTQSHTRPKGNDKALSIDDVPPLFRCKSSGDISDVIKSGKGAIADVFRGHNVLQWYCNAKSTSPGIIQELLRRGVDINALDQRTQKSRGPVIRHTALGYACRNANVKAVHTLLQNGADPRGPTKSATSSSRLPEQDVYGNPIVYPSPLQELLCQPIHGPRPGRCPWKYHLSEEDEEQDNYLDEDDPEKMPVFRALPGLPDAPSEYGPICCLCAADFHIWEPWPETEEDKIAARERRRACYYGQIRRLGARLRACVQLLLDYGCSEPPVAFPQCDDPHLWSGVDYLLETFWHFFRPLAICEGMTVFPEKDSLVRISPEFLSRIPARPVFSLFGEVCDMLLESAGYEAEGTIGATRGLDRLIRLIAEHSEFSAFRQGEYFDVDTQLEQELSRCSSTPR
ncbi:hypothetical protein F4859DRAFT_528188 [Xylaria cf. heliscus]|nr:hypothetical protein F4859DRAFT_528188 [Xylaria cf. heliscus]